jgi:uncharacterized membrane-anchored protein
MEEFLEKGRKGMGSTFTTRLLVGSSLFDAKGVSKLYPKSINFSYLLFLFLSALVPILAVLLATPMGRSLLRLLKIILIKNLGL